MADSVHPPDPAPPLWPARDLALFLDLDGTLLDFAETPDRVDVPASLPQVLMDLAALLGGAVAILSGRPIGAIEALLGATPIALSGVHGAEIRILGESPRSFAPKIPDALRQEVLALADRWPKLLIEDKGAAIAVHVRQAAELSGAVADSLQRLVRRFGPDHQVMAGHAVFEIKSRTCSKGTALREFMRQRPFAARLPVFLGDDTTDEDGFAAAAALGGHGIAVGARPSLAAHWRLPGPTEARRWLGNLAAQGLHQFPAV